MAGVDFLKLFYRMEKYRCTVCEYIYDPESGDPENGIRSEGIMRVGYHAFRGEASVYSSVSRHCVKAGIRVD